VRPVSPQETLPVSIPMRARLECLFRQWRPLLQDSARDMYDRWFCLLSLDLWETESEFARVLDPATLTARLEEGRTLSIAAVRAPDGESFAPSPEEIDSAEKGSAAVTTEVDLFTDDYVAEASIGDRVILHRGDPCGDEACWGNVAQVDRGRIRLRLQASGLASGAFSGTEASSRQDQAGWHLDKLPFTRPREVSRQALLSFFLNADSAVVRAVLPVAPEDAPSEPSRTSAAAVVSHSDTDNAEDEGSGPAKKDSSPDDELLFSEGLRCELNDEQEAAIRQALTAETYHLIHGPPGTGKTRVLARLIRLCLDRGERLLVACPTNVALDRLLIALVELGVRDFIRVGGRATASEGFLIALERLGGEPRLLGNLARVAKSLAAFRNKVRRTPLVAATAYQCLSHSLFIRERFDRVVIDEAGQLDEPSCLGVIQLGKRFVLCGDHLQLPPVVQSRSTDGDPGLERSLFERLLSNADRSRVTRLRVQYRMNREIQDIPSRLFYDGTLTASPEAAARRLRMGSVPADDSEIARITDPAKPAVFVHVDGADTGKARAEEAAVVARIVGNLLRAGVPEHEIGIITPYRVQQALIRQHLSDAHATASVDTVDRFQGGEREVIILSLARADGVTSFLADRKRLNVSLSRARSKLIVIGHGTMLEEHPLFGSLLAGLEHITVTS